MRKTLIYYKPEYIDLAMKLRDNYLEHNNAADIISEQEQDDVKYAGKMQYDEAIFIRPVALILCIAMTVGFAGCDVFGVRKGKDVMNERLIEYNRALNALDYEAVRNLTDWTEEDSDYTAIEKLFDTSYYGDAAGGEFVSCTEYIASTITIKYDVTAVEINFEHATLDVEYEMVDWQSVYQRPHDSFDEVLEDLKKCQDKTTVSADVVFDNVDMKGDWKICRITGLNEVMSFVYTLPE